MRCDLLLTLGLLLWLLAQSTPGYAAEEGPVVYAPDVLGVDRLFMVALKVPTDAPEVQVTVPDSVTLLDRTPLPTQAEIRRFYFRTVKPAKRAEIRFALLSGEVIVPVEIWSFEDLRQYRTLKGIPLPRRWPLGKPLPELKEKQTITTEVQKEAARKGKGSPPGANWLEVPDDDIWTVQPDSTIRRTGWVNIKLGCPFHGTEIYRIRAYYPWFKDTPIPPTWKVRCPIGGEEYPSNDFAKGDMTSGEFPDDGITEGCLYQGNRYHFIAELCREYVRKALSIAPVCADGYLATGDIRFVHKALVALCRLAVEYAYLATMTQHRYIGEVWGDERFVGPRRFEDGPFLEGSGFTEYHIGQPEPQWRNAEAYDQIFPAIDRDPDIIPFLQRKGFDVKTHEDVRRFIEENLMAVWMQGAMDGATSSNEPFAQRGLARMAEVLNYKQGTDFMEWLYHGAGKMRVFIPNTFFRDGAPYESTGGYNSMHVTALGPIIESIEHLREMRPEIYPESKYPSLSKSRRYHSVFDFCMDTVTIDRAFPQIGDGGDWPSYQKLPKVTWHDADTQAFEHAYRLFRDPKFAWALVHQPGWQPSVGFPFTREQIEREAAQWPDDWNDRSSLHDGYGIAILRGGKGDDKRVFWMNYGHNRGHSQDDTLDIGLQAYQGILLSHMGYPRNWGYWEYCWSSHNQARILPYQTMTAQAQLFADAGLIHVAEARATADAEPEQNWQRRMLALVDVAPDQFYCVDFYCISGGEEHWWAFHAQEGEFTTKGIHLTQQEGGTLAGPDVPYGDPQWLKEHGCGYDGYGWEGILFPFPHLYNVERGRHEGVWWVDWKLKTGDGLHLRMTVPSAQAMEVNLCDGTSPAGGRPYEMKWIMMHKKGNKPVRSQVLSILEPYMNEPVIREVLPLKLSGDDEAGFASVGCVLRLAHRTDTILASADPAVERPVEGDLTFAGRFGFYAEKDGVPVAMSLIGGTTLRKGEFGITLESPEYRAKITQVDRVTETVTVSPAPPSPEALAGNYIYITNPVRRSAYKVLEARAVPGGADLGLDLDSRIGTGRVAGVEDYRVKTSTSFVLQGYRYYLGARLVNADRTAEYRITGVASENAAMIDPEVHPEAKADQLAQEFAEGTWFEVYDYGVGDEVVWPYAVSVTRTGPNLYAVTAPVEVTMTLPANYRWEQVVGETPR